MPAESARLCLISYRLAMSKHNIGKICSLASVIYFLNVSHVAPTL